MRTLAIFVEITEEMLEALDEIAMMLPCWVSLEEDCLTITCRQEDMSSVEKNLQLLYKTD